MAGNQQYNNSNFLYLQQEIFYLSERLNSLIGRRNNNSAAAAISLLAKATISLNPTISETYTGFTNVNYLVTITGVTISFDVGEETITDSNGSTGIIKFWNGSSFMVLDSVVFSGSNTSFSGTLTGGITGATATVIASIYYPFQIGETVTDSNGSTGIILTDNGSEITFQSVAMVSPNQSFSGTITGGTSGATATAGIFLWGDQLIRLAGGNNFADVNLIISAPTGEDAPPIAKDLEVWSGAGRTGTLYFSTNIGSGVDSLQNLAGYTNYISVLGGDILSVTSPKLNVPSVIYITLSAVEQITETVQLVVNGTIQN